MLYACFLWIVMLCIVFCDNAIPSLPRSETNDNSVQRRLQNKKKKREPDFVPPSKPDYTDLEKKEPSKLHTDTAFITACKEMAGYYKDPTKQLKNTILLASVNNGYKDFMHNFKCYMDRLGLKFLPIALDEGIYSYILNNKISPTYLMPDIPGRDRVAAEPSGFGGKNFNLIGCRKLEAVGAALTLGYDVVFSDVDIAWLQDPIDRLFYPGIDYVHSTNKGCNVKWLFNETMEGNTGFYAVKSNPATIRTWDLAYRACSRAPLYDDQTMFWLVLRTNEQPYPAPIPKCPVATKDAESAVRTAAQLAHSRVAISGRGRDVGGVTNTSSSSSSSSNSMIVTCPLDDCQFSASHLKDQNGYSKLLMSLQNKKAKAYMVHANWMNGKEVKKAAMASKGLWIARRVEEPGAVAVQGLGNKKPKVKGNWTCVAPTGGLV